MSFCAQEILRECHYVIGLIRPYLIDLELSTYVSWKRARRLVLCRDKRHRWSSICVALIFNWNCRKCANDLLCCDNRYVYFKLATCNGNIQTSSLFLQCLYVRKQNLVFLLPTLFIQRTALLPFILLRFNTKMETLIQLKNNPFLMGLCRNCPPPDLQYDNSSGKSCAFLGFFSFVFFSTYCTLSWKQLWFFFYYQSSIASLPLLGSQARGWPSVA